MQNDVVLVEHREPVEAFSRDWATEDSNLALAEDRGTHRIQRRPPRFNCGESPSRAQDPLRLGKRERGDRVMEAATTPGDVELLVAKRKLLRDADDGAKAIVYPQCRCETQREASLFGDRCHQACIERSGQQQLERLLATAANLQHPLSVTGAICCAAVHAA